MAPDGAAYVAQTLTPFMLGKPAAHRSAMLRDVQAGRGTGIDDLDGAVVRMGRARGWRRPATTRRRASSGPGKRALPRRDPPGSAPPLQPQAGAVVPESYPFGRRSITRFAFPCERSILPVSTTFTPAVTPM